MNFTKTETAKLTEMGFIFFTPELAEKEAFREYEETSYRTNRLEDCYLLVTRTYDEEDRKFDENYTRFKTFDEMVKYLD